MTDRYFTGTSNKIVQVNGHKKQTRDDRLSARELEHLITALRLYYGDLMDIRATERELCAVRDLCKRLAEPGRDVVIVESH